ncbi:TPA: replication protein P [Pasteurella multocida]|uniref:replication protein P n=2 Tax=Pasteurella multocida TaxID=747 RepID=UPI0003537800|nr:replication protein P [Pasteurella multocida]ANJ89313.1 putative replication protein P [Pasteurella multocida subsp. multocida HB01]ANJ90564.1 putative replication protein P [Pasteurella multocida subsp. multocida HB01]AON58462.1 replication protein P [Pasteurella multocida]AON59302.1 replication protein P [Pasteurella multocida]AUK27462.1 replication protein P [Pasteurella multocida]
MKPANQIAMGLIGSDKNYKAPQIVRAEVTAEMNKTIDFLFTRLKTIFPAWKSAFSSDREYQEAKKYWLETLINERITSVAQIRIGVERARKSESPFFPSVGQFVAWCNDGALAAQGMPALEELLERIKAYSRYHGFDNQHEFQFKNNVEQYLIFDLYCRNKEFGWSAEELRKHAKAFLKATADKLARGEELPELALALPQKASFISPEEQKKINLNGIALARAALKRGF